MRSLAAILALALALRSAPLFAQGFALPPTAPTLPMQMPEPPPKNFLRPDVPLDLAFGAFQRGYYGAALREAMKRIEANPSDGAAMTIMGELYKDGLGVRTDPTEAARWWRLASARGDAQGAFELGVATLAGRGVPDNRGRAQALFQQAAGKGVPGAFYNLGLMALDGDIKNYPEAAKNFQRAADLGSSDAKYALGLLMKDGRGVEKDGAKAAGLLKEAADEKLVAAQIDYAIMLFNGEGVAKDEATAAGYFSRAASAGNPIAENRLARLYATGRGVDKNMVEAMKWHILARAAGVSDDWLDSLYAGLAPRERVAVEDAVRKQVGG